MRVRVTDMGMGVATAAGGIITVGIITVGIITIITSIVLVTWLLAIAPRHVITVTTTITARAFTSCLVSESPSVVVAGKAAFSTGAASAMIRLPLSLPAR